MVTEVVSVYTDSLIIIRLKLIIRSKTVKITSLRLVFYICIILIKIYVIIYITKIY